MANVRVRRTAAGPRYDVKFVVNATHRTRTFKSAADASAYKRRIEGEELAGLVIDPRGGERVFGEYADEWLGHRLVKGRPLAPSTRQGYEALLRRHLRPAFGQTRLRQITPERVRTWHAQFAAHAPDQAAKGYRLLRAILATAVHDELIGRNPCAIKGAGTERARERPMLDTSVVLALAESITPRLRALVYVAGFVGLRSGELCGLERRDVDLARRTLTVERQAVEITGQGRILTAPKTEAGRRVVALPGFVVEVLSGYLDAYVAPEPDAVLFTRPSGKPLRRADLSNEWRAACDVVGLSGVRVHDLRHHAATLVARNRDVTLKELMAHIGHATPVAALRYQHATAEREQAIATYLDDVIAAARRSPASVTVPDRS
ncbi:MAG TPA: site-specific integrase [Acidimicrobiales bacterium]|nr:site-specific integrase [Acidimicrobiales bacterium]